LYDSDEARRIESDFRKLLDTHRSSIVAIGETGLDYHYLNADPDIRESQKQNQYAWLESQWKLAQVYDLPLVIHTRDAREDTIFLMKKYGIHRAVMHCFSEDWDFASELLEFSPEIYFSFSGILTYKSAPRIQEAGSKIPLNRILIETDAPFLSPQVVRGTVNEPANTRYVLEKLISLRAESPEYVEQQIYENSLRFYGIKKFSN
jgi:TatD DNase family protein